jgi:4-amino-4-deoxy-L-arabinose transferase-like glycosyltransferase
MAERDEAIRRHDLAAVALCVVVLISALIVGHLHRIGDFDVETDFYGTYAVQARNLLEGRSYTYPQHPPGYAILLAGTSLLTHDLFVAGKLISAVAVASFAWITYLLFKSLFSSRIALGTVGLLAPAAFPFSFLAASDILGAALKLLPLWALLRHPVLTSKWCLLAGLFAGMAYLVRYDAIFLIISIGFSLLVINLDQVSLQRRLAQAGLFACGAILMASPWLIVNWRMNGSPLANSGYLLVATHFYLPGHLQQFDAALREQAPGAAVARLDVASKFHSLVEVVSYDPTKFFGKYFKDLYSNAGRMAIYVLQFPAYLLAPVGLVLLLLDLSPRRLTYLLVCSFGYLSLNLVRFQPRYYLFLFPVAFLSVAYLIFRTMPDRSRLFKVRVPVGWLVLVVASVFLSVSAYRQTSNVIASEPRYLLEIAGFLRDRSSADEKMIARKPHLAYLAGLVNTFAFVYSGDAYLSEAQARGARYLVYSKYDAKLWPGLLSLRDPAAVPPELKLIYEHPASQTLIYEVEIHPRETTSGIHITTDREK